jgi:hypothetical protein
MKIRQSGHIADESRQQIGQPGHVARIGVVCVVFDYMMPAARP